MKIIKIVNTEMGEVAYLFDGERIVKVFVEDLTQPAKPAKVPIRKTVPRYEEEEELEFEAPRTRTVRPRPRVQVEDYEEELPPRKATDQELEQDIRGPAPRDPAARPRPSIIPPGIMSVMRPHDMPGAAMETRRV